MDLGHVCRGIRRREYKTCRDVRLDMWLVFGGCVKYNAHPGNKDAIPSFVSIAQHLREYFNQLWHECMMPSELPENPSEYMRNAFEDRSTDRQKRLDSTGVLVLQNSFLVQLARKLSVFLDGGGCVDRLDTTPIFHETGNMETDVDIVVQRLREFQRQLQQHAQEAAVEYQLVQLCGDLKRCYTENVLENDPVMRNIFANRIDRFLWRQCTSLHEANSRGVTQSSIWGNIAACIWARESSKKTYWPALCLGILPPPEQGEGWHHAVTERNEARLPHNLRGPLMQAKKQCEKNQKRANHSYFLVEFLGTHEFTWVRETDIVESFDSDPSNDPNKKPGGKKGRSSRSGSNAVGSRMYQRAIEECLYANNEYESVLNDAMSTVNNGQQVDDNEDDDDEVTYSFAVLAQSDDEADMVENHGYQLSEDALSLSDVEEINCLLANNGFIDVGTLAKKGLKKKPSVPKASASKKKSSSKEESSTSSKKPTKESTQKSKVDKKESKELDKRRKKRTRDRDKALRALARKKRKGPAVDGAEADDEIDLVYDKKNRATAIVKAYLDRLSHKEEAKSLALGGVLTMPAAMVDSTGILGSTIAFRAAAGMLKMPDDGKEAEEKRKPWSAIDPTQHKSSEKRIKMLMEKKELISKQLGILRSHTSKRRERAAEVKAKKVEIESSIAKNDVVARVNTFKKKAPKKSPTKPTPIKSPKKEPKAQAVPTERDMNSEVDPEVVVEVEGTVEEGTPVEVSEMEVEAEADNEEDEEVESGYDVDSVAQVQDCEAAAAESESAAD